MLEIPITLRSAMFAFMLALVPFGAAADVTELSQSQLRQLVQQEQILRAEKIASTAVSDFGGVVIDIRSFLSNGRMTYRLLLQRDDGSVIELLYNGVQGERISHTSEMGQAVATEAKSTGGGSSLPANANAQANANANADSRGNSGNRGNSGDRGNSGGGGGNSGDRGNDRDR